MALPQRFCLNHVDVPAAGNCVQCHRPMCEACIVSYGAKPFCSAECIDKYQLFKSRYKPEKEKGGSLVATLVKLAVVVAVVLGALLAGRWYGIEWCGKALDALGL